MSTAGPAADEKPSARPRFEPTQEVRFAVVLYGGVSLAIYIHGVTQELLRLVRATAPAQSQRPPLPKDPHDPAKTGTIGWTNDALLSQEELRGSEKVYRKLGQILAAGCDAPEREPLPGDPVRTRFLVDVISGTSAGGINGIFLAKALAGCLSMDALKDLWVREGDVATLLNDKGSYEGLGLPSPKGRPASLLNGHRMYCSLLEALAGMDEQQAGTSQRRSTLVDELDVSVTTTDIQGLVQPIPLTDQTVHERRHRHVFRFRYSTESAGGEKRNDFQEQFDPFLAYAARCTSSFPFAFEPMALEDIDAVLKLPRFSRYADGDRALWRRFYREYMRDSGGAVVGSEERDQKFGKVAFGDGGYLDNRPFSYATETLRRRRSDVPVDRKLLYVEPSPEHPEEEADRTARPDALENVQAALFSLPRYETIREDIERIQEYNQLIRRVQVVLDGREDDVQHRKSKGRTARISGEDWRRRDLREMIGVHGVSYGAYHRLRVDAATDALATLLVQPLGCEQGSPTWQGVRELLCVWRNQRFVCYKDQNDAAKSTENEFLYHFDFEWWGRRIRFALERADRLYCENASDLPSQIRRIPDLKPKLKLKLEALIDAQNPEWLAGFRGALSYAKWGLNSSLIDLLRALRDLGSREDENEQRKVYEKIATARTLIDNLELGSAGLLEVAAPLSEEERRVRAEDKLEDIGAQRFADTLEAVRDVLSWSIRRSAHACEVVLDRRLERKRYLDVSNSILEIDEALRRLGAPAQVGRPLLSHYYGNFEQYDLITFPIVYETGIAEADHVEILRISPEDATGLFDERSGTRCRTPTEGTSANGRVTAGYGLPKLAGNTLGHFGAFLKKEWRIHDMLWGRLDAAERLISALLPGEGRRGLRERLIREAHHEILAEEMQPGQEEQLRQLLAEAIELAPAFREAAQTREAPGRGRKRPDFEVAVERAEARRQMEAWWLQDFAGAGQTRIDRLVRCALGDESLAALFVETSQSGRALPPEESMRSLARATEIVGHMLESLASQTQGLPGVRRWAGLVTFFGRLFWGVVEVAVPRGVWNLITRHWLGLAFTFEVFLIASGTLFGQEELAQAGWILLAVTAGLRLILFLLGGALSPSRKSLRWARGAAVAILVALTGLGVLAVPETWRRAEKWIVDHYRRVFSTRQEAPTDRLTAGAARR